MELEIKFAPVTKKVFRLVCDRLGIDALDTVTMEAHYFDTDNGYLSANKISLRRRAENGESVYTMKRSLTMDGGVAVREEEEIAADNIESALVRFSENPSLAPAVREIRSHNLVTLAKMSFIREKCLYSPKEGVVFELSHDTGVMSGPRGAKGDILEMEIELKSGSLEDFPLVLNKLADMELPVEKRSKLHRARLL